MAPKLPLMEAGCTRIATEIGKDVYSLIALPWGYAMRKLFGLLVAVVVATVLSCQDEGLPKQGLPPTKPDATQSDSASDLKDARISYSINMLCISKDLASGQSYICPEKYFTPLVESAKLWSDANPGTPIHIWYDSTTASERAVAHSRELIEKTLGRSKKSRVLLRNISDIPIVSQNRVLFSGKSPLYFRIDLLKLVIISYEIADNKMQSAIFTDVEVGDLRPQKDRMGYGELFDRETLQQIKLVGLLNNGLENQFLQVWRTPSVIEALKLWININLARIALALNLDDPLRHGTLKKIYVSAFYTTVRFFHRYYQASQYGRIEIKAKKVFRDSKDGWVPYDAQKHGIIPFGDFWGVSDEMGWISHGEMPLKNPTLVTESVVRYLDKEGKPIKVLKHERKVDVRGGSSHIDEVPPRDPNDTKQYEAVLWK